MLKRVGKDIVMQPLEQRRFYSASLMTAAATASPSVSAIALDNVAINRTAPPVNRSRVASLAITFDSDVAANLDGSDLLLRNLTTKANVPPPAFHFSYDPATFTGTWSFDAVPGAIGNSLPDGRYLATLSAVGVSGTGALLDGDGNGTAGGNLVIGFTRRFGDANGNGIADSTDRTALNATMSAHAGDPNFDGRFDYNGDSAIDTVDQTAFNARYGIALATTPPAAPATPVATPVSSTAINVGWRSGPGDTSSFRLERATVSTGPFTAIGTFNAATTNFRNSGLTAGKRYWYRVVATSPFGTSPASASVNLLASLAPKLSVSTGSLLLTDVVDGLASAAKTIKITNTGTGGLVIPPTGFTFTGTNADQFTADVGSYSILLGAGQSVNLRVRMNASVIGEASATLKIAGNDAGGAVASIALRGLGTDAATGGPTVQQVLDFHRVPMTITRVPGVGATAANERTLPLMTKVGTGPVTIQVLSTSAFGMLAAEVIRLGWYTPPAAPATDPVLTPLFVIPGTDNTSLSPTISGVTSFDPGGATFGFFADWTALAGRRTWTQDELNTFEPSAPWLHKIRFYPLRAADGSTVANAYVVTAEVTGVQIPRTVVMIVRNVRHASLPATWQSQDVGAAAIAGSATVTQGSYAIAGGGTGIGGDADAFHFAYRSLSGDGEIVARIAAAGASGAAGVTIRTALDPTAANATMEIGADGTASFHARTATGGTTDPAITAATAGGPAWVRLVRAGGTITGYWSDNGFTWTLVGSAAVSLGSTAMLGLTATSADDASLAHWTIDTVRVTPADASGRAAVTPKVVAPATAAGLVTVSAIASDAATSGRLVVDGTLVGSLITGAGPYTFTWNSLSVTSAVHSVGVETTDRFGNRSRTTLSVTVSNPDLPPEVWFPTLTEGQQVKGTFGLTAAAKDERGVVDVTYYIDGTAIGSAVTTAPYLKNWNSTTIADGWHTLTAKAKDTAGHITTSLPLRLRVSNKAGPTSPELQTVQIAARRTELNAWSPLGGQVIPQGLRLTNGGRSSYGGDLTTNLGATGFFRAQKVNGRWWLVDPDGYRYFDNSVVAVDPHILPNNQADFTAKFGEGEAGLTNWSQWIQSWLKDIGVYTAAWQTTTVLQQTGSTMNYNLVVQLMSGFAKTVGAARAGSGNSTYPSGAMPVFDPAFVTYCNNYFTNIFPVKFPGMDPRNDPHLVGYMTDNELPWSTSTLDNYLMLPAGDANRAAAEAWVRGRGITIPTDADKTDFLSYVAETYFRITSAAARAYDPNHLLLGARFLGGDGQKTYLYQAAKPYIDVASINFYDSLSPGSVLGKAASSADMPFMVSEFYFKGDDSGLANRAGFGYTVRTQADRGAAYQALALSTLQNRNAVGLSWLTLMDNNELNSKADPSNTDANKGLMPINYPDANLNPYKPLTDRIGDINANLYELIRRLAP